MEDIINMHHIYNPDITVTDILTVIFRQRTTDFSWRISKREHYGLTLVKSGSLIYTIDNTERIIRPGELLLLNKNETYCVTNNRYEPPDTLCEFYTIHFDITEQDIPLLNRITPLPNYNSLLKLFHKQYSCNKSESFDSRFRSKAILYQILAEAYNAHYSATILSPAQKNLEKAKRFIDEHYMDKFTVESVCQMAGYSPTHFKRLFHQYYGMSPINYITMVRLEKAKSMLLSGLFNLDEIAEACGFSTEYYFSRVFKKHTGCSPSRYSSLE